MSRIEPLTPPYDPSVGVLLESMMPPGVPPIGLFRTFAHNVAMTEAMGGWGRYELSSRLSLSMRQRELVIDRVTARCGCEYEWGVHMAFFGLLILAFAYFYTSIQFDPHKQADQIRKQGGFIPGIRPGYQTERYLGRILNRITLPGALFVAAVALLPAFLLAKTMGDSPAGQQLGFFGISILIAVGVSLETVKQIDGQLMMRNYEGFLDSSKAKAKASKASK